MSKVFEGYSQLTGRISSHRSLRGLGWGLIGGLVGTLIVDLILMGVLSALGLPVLSCFSIVGNTVTQFFSIQSMDTGGVIRLGVATHYLVGPFIGVIFGVLVAQVKALRVTTRKKSIVLAIFYVQILSQPLLVMACILLKMTLPEILQWYGWAFVMHILLAVVLGSIVGYGLKLGKNHVGSSPQSMLH